MSLFRSAILLCSILVSSVIVMGQDEQSNVLDGVYVKENTPSRRVIPYTNLREADVFWSKRVWRRIDVSKKMNQVFYYPESEAQGRKNLFDVIKEGVLEEGTLTAYDPGSAVAPDDMFRQEYTPDEVKKKLNPEKLVNEYDEFGDVVGTSTVVEEITSSEIKFYEIKEDWYFEKQKSYLEVRIIGLKPVREFVDETGQPQLMDMFWIYFPQARYVFANAEVYNRNNDAERRTYEDIFWKRQFESEIIKVSNVYDRSIADYKVGLDALLEAEKINEMIRNFEHDVWHF